jgi:hypothetical protein
MNTYVEDVCCYPSVQTIFFCVARHRSNTLGSISITNWPPGKDFVTGNLYDLVSHTL